MAGLASEAGASSSDVDTRSITSGDLFGEGEGLRQTKTASGMWAYSSSKALCSGVMRAPEEGDGVGVGEVDGACADLGWIVEVGVAEAGVVTDCICLMSRSRRASPRVNRAMRASRMARVRSLVVVGDGASESDGESPLPIIAMRHGEADSTSCRSTATGEGE